MALVPFALPRALSGQPEYHLGNRFWQESSNSPGSEDIIESKSVKLPLSLWFGWNEENNTKASRGNR
jgi:hypothetical protein